MAIFIILCVLTVAIGFVQLALKESMYNNECHQTPGGVTATLAAILFISLVWVCVRFAFPGARIVAWLLTAWLVFTTFANSGPRGFLYVVMGLFALVLFEQRTYVPKRTGDGWALVQPVCHMLTRTTESLGTDTFSHRLITERGAEMNTPSYSTIYGLKDSLGRLHIPMVCDYDDGFTDCSIEYYLNNERNVQLFSLRRPDGTTKRLDFKGGDPTKKNYEQPRYSDIMIDLVSN